MRSAGSVALLGCAAAACAAPGGDVADEVPAGRLANPELVTIEALGTWDEAGPDGSAVVRAWVDAEVANRRYDKHVVVEVAAPHPAGWVRTLHPAAYEGVISGVGGGARERWGADTIELFPDGGPGGGMTGPAVVRVRVQDDVDGDGQDEMVVTPWRRLWGDGALVAPGFADEPDPWTDVATPAAPDGSATTMTFAPFDDPGQVILDELDAVIARALAAPGERHTVHLAVFNVTDDELIDRLIAAHHAGVEVRVVFDGRKLRPWYGWYGGDDRLIAAGVPTIGALRPGGAMHDKIAVFDGRRVATGSFNWEPGARRDNHEALIVTGAPALVEAYAARMTALAGGVRLARRHGALDPAGEASVSFAPDEAPARVLGRLIDAARDSIHVAMITCKDVAYDDGGPTSLFAKLAAARARGVDVRVIVDHGIHEASEYHGVVSPDDSADEWLEARGIHVVRADNPRAPYASMHHKLTVIDGEVVVAGAFNWYFDAAYRNDEDQLVLRDPAIAARATGELAALLREYDPAWDPAEWAPVTVRFEVTEPRTRWGDTVAVVGDVAELGGWDVGAAVPLDGGRWPVWTGEVVMPAGTHARWKVVTLRGGGGASWEPGADRPLTVATDAPTMVVPATAR
jgi:phosphatidylserine/phosphatidylglycerophosphate/cardiolipin synthase-like enzyme